MAIWLCQRVLDTIWHAILAKKKSTLPSMTHMHAHHRAELLVLPPFFLSNQPQKQRVSQHTRSKAAQIDTFYFLSSHFVHVSTDAYFYSFLVCPPLRCTSPGTYVAPLVTSTTSDVNNPVRKTCLATETSLHSDFVVVPPSFSVDVAKGAGDLPSMGTSIF